MNYKTQGKEYDEGRWTENRRNNYERGREEKGQNGNERRKKTAKIQPKTWRWLNVHYSVCGLWWWEIRIAKGTNWGYCPPEHLGQATAEVRPASITESWPHRSHASLETITMGSQYAVVSLVLASGANGGWGGVGVSWMDSGHQWPTLYWYATKWTVVSDVGGFGNRFSIGDDLGHDGLFLNEWRIFILNIVVCVWEFFFFFYLYKCPSVPSTP